MAETLRNSDKGNNRHNVSGVGHNPRHQRKAHLYPLHRPQHHHQLLCFKLHIIFLVLPLT